ncbi:GNAT family N-acetyltransferase [Bacillus aquiflavi]|uniref:GNAT family N-acetyltransferase n=1 Tax=Bacillus aquiflavi TaxID=2672567 RepID=UPI001CA81C3F|nr:GNAT family N-acetyltransferase [Bacillus aquiflavi]UAC49716.1 GNAT family N-acetyltransferase [Bacillus aquiflavi]
MKLETKRLSIIPCTKQTIEIAMKQNYDHGPQIQTYLELLKEDPSLLYWGVWLVIRKNDGVIIGDIGFKGKPDKNKTVEVGYGFLESFWNQGYATEAVGALIKWAFDTSKVKKVVAETLQNNYGSMRVLEKLGMIKVNETKTMINWKIKQNFTR